MFDELPMNETSHEPHEAEPARWRVGVVAPDCSPNFAVSRTTIPAGEVLAAVDEYSKAMPDGCFAFAFRSRTESFDRRCAALAALFAVHVGKGDFAAADLADYFGVRVGSIRADLREQAQTCIDLRGELQTARRRVVAAAAAFLAIGVLLGAAAGFLLFSEHAPFRMPDHHAEEERAGRAEYLPCGGRGLVRGACRLAPVTLGFVDATPLEGAESSTTRAAAQNA